MASLTWTRAERRSNGYALEGARYRTPRSNRASDGVGSSICSAHYAPGSLRVAQASGR